MKRKLAEKKVKIKSSKVEFVENELVRKMKITASSRVTDQSITSENEDFIQTQCNFTLQASSLINHVVCGFFSNSDRKDLAFSKGKNVVVSKVDLRKEGSKASIKTFHSVNLFESISDMKALANPKKKVLKDSLIIVTNSGKLFILEFSKKKNCKKIAYEYASPYSEFSLNTPRFLATHPSGDAFLLCECLNEVSLFTRSKTKNVFLKQVVNIFGEIHDMVGIPTNETCVEFAVLRSKEDCKQDVVMLTFDKEKKKLMEKAENLNSCFSANVIVPVISIAANTPRGVLVFSTSCIIYKSLDSDYIEIPVFIPSESINLFNQSASQSLSIKTDKDKVFICATHYMDNLYFALTDDGDLFEVSLVLNEENKVKELTFLKIESWPTAKSLCMLTMTHLDEQHYLFVGFKVSHHCLFRINRSLLTFTKNSERGLNMKKFTLVQSIPNNFPIFDFLAEDSADSKIYLISKKAPHSALHILELGYKIICGDSLKLECSSVKQTWLCRKNVSGVLFGSKDLATPEISTSMNTHADAINVSSHQGTPPVSKSSSKYKFSAKSISKNKSKPASKSNVLSRCDSLKSKKISECLVTPDSQICKASYSKNSNEYLLFMSHKRRTTIALMKMSSHSKISFDTKEYAKTFITGESTLLCIPFGDTGGLLQVTPSRLIYVKNKVRDWSWFSKPLLKCVANRYCILLYSEDGILHYFSYEKEKITVSLPYESKEKLICLAIGEKRKLPDSPLMALASKDNLFLIYFKNQKEDLMYVCCLMYDAINYLEIVSLKTKRKEQKSSDEEYLFIGQKNAIIIYKLNYYEDPSEVKTYHFYPEAIVMSKIILWKKQSILVYSVNDDKNKWILYHHQNDWRLHVCHLDLSLKHIMSFSSNQLLIIDSNHHIKLGKVTRFEKCFSKAEIPLTFTPRLIIQDKIFKKLLILESEKKSLEEGEYSNKKHICQFSSHIFRNKTRRKQWISCIEIIDSKLQRKESQPVLKKSDVLFLSGLSLDSSVQLNSANNSENRIENIIILGILSEFGKSGSRSGIPSACSYGISFRGNSISNFRLTDRIFLEGPPLVMKIAQGKICIAERNHLGIYTYDMANLKLVLVQKKKLFDDISTMDISFDEELVLIGHTSYNISILKVSGLEVLFEDHSPRCVNSAIFIENFKFAIADTFGNIFIITLSKKNLPFACLLKEEFELKTDSQLHVGENIMKILLKPLHPDANPCLLYGSTFGYISSLVELFEGTKCLVALERHLKYMEPFIYRNNVAGFSSLCNETKFVIDGDLCENYLSKPIYEKKENKEMDIIRKEIWANIQNIKLQNSI